MDEAQAKAIQNFWHIFTQNVDAFEVISSPEDEAYEIALAALQNINENLWLEYSLEAKELIVTAHGNTKLFGLADEIVSRAPQIRDWKTISLKPKNGFPETTIWEGTSIVISDIVFDPFEIEDDSGLGLDIYVPNVSSENLEDARAALLVALDHGLGERFFSEHIVHIEAHCLDDTINREEYIALTDLEEYIRWRLDQLNSE